MYLGMKATKGWTPGIMTSAQIVSSGQSYVGTVRADNQDSFRICEPDADHIRRSYGCLYAVADGMGGYQYGDIASAQAIKAFFETFYSGKGTKFARNLQRAVHAANLAVYQLAQLLDRARLGTTLSAVNLAGDKLYLAHVGDSRVYLIRDRQAICLTRDHTKVGDLVALRALSPDKVRTHAGRSELNHSIGTGLFVQPDIKQLALHAGDAIILCSDGIWSVIEDDEFADLAYDIESPRDLGQVLMDTALKRDSDDNLSLVAIRVEHLTQDSASAEKRRLLLWSVLRRQA
jgi:serine/threonine protein phosphatase PrpC